MPAPIPHELEALVMELLAKEPAARPESADVVRARLRAIPLATPWTEEDAAAWWDARDART